MIENHEQRQLVVSRLMSEADEEIAMEAVRRRSGLAIVSWVFGVFCGAIGTLVAVVNL